LESCLVQNPAQIGRQRACSWTWELSCRPRYCVNSCGNDHSARTNEQPFVSRKGSQPRGGRGCCVHERSRGRQNVLSMRVCLNASGLCHVLGRVHALPHPPSCGFAFERRVFSGRDGAGRGEVSCATCRPKSRSCEPLGGAAQRIRSRVSHMSRRTLA